MGVIFLDYYGHDLTPAPASSARSLNCLAGLTGSFLTSLLIRRSTVFYVGNSKLSEHLDTGHRLERPTYCPPEM